MSKDRAVPKTVDLDALSMNALWKLYEDLRGVLISRITEEKNALDLRLRDLSQPVAEATSRPVRARAAVVRRPYPKVIPIYRNPAAPSETWSGRGNRPRWLAAQIASGKRVEDFLIKAKPAAHLKRISKRK